jgi:hypothetical protein
MYLSSRSCRRRCCFNAQRICESKSQSGVGRNCVPYAAVHLRTEECICNACCDGDESLTSDCGGHERCQDPKLGSVKSKLAVTCVKVKRFPFFPADFIYKSTTSPLCSHNSSTSLLSKSPYSRSRLGIFTQNYSNCCPGLRTSVFGASRIFCAACSPFSVHVPWCRLLCTAFRGTFKVLAAAHLILELHCHLYVRTLQLNLARVTAHTLWLSVDDNTTLLHFISSVPHFIPLMSICLS